MINNQAKRLLEINNPNEFKVFSRKSIIYSHVEECDEYQLYENYTQQSIFDKFIVTQNDQKQQKNSLENKLIQIFKKSLSSNQKNMKNSSFLKEKNSQSQQKGLTFDTNNDTTNNSLESSFYALYQKSEEQTSQKLSIKASTFQNQIDCYCCLVIEEINDYQRINILSKIASDNKQNFFQFCLYLAVGKQTNCSFLNLNSQSFYIQ
ncbi:hypothetical protein TTHERM_00483430 (macronuclear) [Tetrahymena thermophila SB210]|uniref:Uncharacterized protein n=1 Tax=Tetrahymena thermophila (strain SB210) TaxID=312017 RepID=I7MJU7_TETTS|nr:hypothetical protein TTHERM_00483430 [Tetrahymena thermophila SB210]EAR97211.1 hypothetical protein TTHERM_00483430 [Tetrahymena thermophila SB210]|eukprot:XP_001017456.1 hypothetical protein TTHERM_00483430 [Tetrahymena thermophila SB210]